MTDIRISILMEDQAKMGFLNKKFLAQHGLSIFIESDQNVLFDAGPSDGYLTNASLLDLDLQKTDLVALSHGHWDHTDGLSFLHLEKPKRKLVAHPNVFADRHKTTGEFNGMALSQERLADAFDLVLTTETVHISENIVFLAQIPRLNDFEAQKTSFFQIVDGQRQEDYIMDDTALVIKSKYGLIIVTGCSHAGICNIVDYSKHVCNMESVYMVLGGFHMLGDDRQLEKTVEYFEANPVDHLYPMHCTDLSALCAFDKHFGVHKLCAGDTIEI